MATSSVSVIVPTYNSGRFIGEAIDSILSQTRPPEQIIIVDDGSIDHTERVIRRYPDPRIEYIKQKNSGVSAARNVGLALAQHEFVTFLDADDRWHPTFVERMREFLVANANAVCVFSNFVRFEDRTGKVLRDQFSYYSELRSPALHDDVPSAAVRILRKPYAFSSLVRMGEIPAFTVVMMFRRALIAGMRFDPTLTVCEDTHFCLRAFMRGDVAFTSEVLCDVRRHDTNVTRKYETIALQKLNALKALSTYVTDDANIGAYHDRLVKAHMDAAIYQMETRQVRAALRTYGDGLFIPSSPMRKVKGLARLLLNLV